MARKRGKPPVDDTPDVMSMIPSPPGDPMDLPDPGMGDRNDPGLPDEDPIGEDEETLQERPAFDTTEPPEEGTLVEEPAEDPRALARRLAAEAKAKLAQARDDTEDPRELARRLAAEAKARIAGSTPSPPDPRELARRVAAEAKARLGKPAATEDPRELARRLAAEAKARLAEQPPPQPKKPSSLSSRAGRAPIGTAEALEIEKRRAAEQTAQAVTAPAAVRRQSVAAPTEPAPAGPDVRKLVAEALPGAIVVRVLPVTNPAMFTALWQAHRARAASSGDVQLAVTAGHLLHAVHTLPAGALVAVEVSIAGAAWAAWVDTRDGRVLGAAQPSSTWLAGL